MSVLVCHWYRYNVQKKKLCVWGGVSPAAHSTPVNWLGVSRHEGSGTGQWKPDQLHADPDWNRLVWRRLTDDRACHGVQKQCCSARSSHSTVVMQSAEKCVMVQRWKLNVPVFFDFSIKRNTHTQAHIHTHSSRLPWVQLWTCKASFYGSELQLPLNWLDWCKYLPHLFPNAIFWAQISAVPNINLIENC